MHVFVLRFPEALQKPPFLLTFPLLPAVLIALQLSQNSSLLDRSR